MTCWEKHRIACKILLGDPCLKIHEWLDNVIGGEDHRKHTHDLLSISAIIFISDKALNLTPEEKLKFLKAGIIHLVQDKGKNCITDIEQSLTKALKNEFIVPPGIASNWFNEVKDLVVEIFGNITVQKDGRSVKISPEILGQTFEILHTTYKYQDYDMQKKVIEEFERYKGLVDRFLPLINACSSCRTKDSCLFR